MAKTKKKRPLFLRLVLVLLALAVAGTVLLSAFRDKIEQWEYPLHYQEYVEYYAGKYGIDPMILYAFIRTESNFDPNVDSNADARGLMQITEVTFDWIKTKIAPTEDLTFDDLYDPETNIRFGTYFVCYCLKKYDNHLATAAAAYHNGLGVVQEGLVPFAELLRGGQRFGGSVGDGLVFIEQLFQFLGSFHWEHPFLVIYL